MVRARDRVTSLAKANLPQGGGGGFLPTQMESEAQLWPLTWLSQALNPLLPKLSHKLQQLLRKEPLQICRLRSAQPPQRPPRGPRPPHAYTSGHSGHRPHACGQQPVGRAHLACTPQLCSPRGSPKLS